MVKLHKTNKFFTIIIIVCYYTKIAPWKSDFSFLFSLFNAIILNIVIETYLHLYLLQIHSTAQQANNEMK